MFWFEWVKMVVVIKVGNSIIRGKFWWGEVGLLFDVDCFKFLGSVVSEESYKGTRRRGNREIVLKFLVGNVEDNLKKLKVGIRCRWCI